jgi:hypothetical protein
MHWRRLRAIVIIPESARTKIMFDDGGIVEIYHVDKEEAKTVTEVG